MPARSGILRLQCYKVPGDQDVSCVPAVRTAPTEVSGCRVIGEVLDCFALWSGRGAF